ncbi:bifunctional sugar phosphate isomerase/epimerase/4-hydroxyphenylpyruvate dioxygenase family protein [Kerstersia similis]|uniref:bifunctional sugar phosphate isomerase/epimerase/4-hydroxyphenylpyruvate dioxygenase family protein n=1 Tax=Kerstersia similis TaxID=206505 RepID=UPI0039F002BE
MRRSIATVSLSGTLREKLEAISAAGFDGIELFENDFIHFQGSARDLRHMAADLGLTVDLYQPFRDFEAMPDALLARSLERAERKFDIMQEMGCGLVLCCSNTSAHAIDDPALAADQLAELAERAARRNLRIGYEALSWGRHVRLYGQAWDIVKRADHPHLGLILDSFHTLSLKDDPAGIADIPGDRIFFLQMADAPLLTLDVIDWARHHRCFPGQGKLDVENFFLQTLLAGYSGPLSLEIFNDVFRETPNRRTALDAMRSLLYLESWGRERLARPGAGENAARFQATAARIELFNPPPAPVFSGVSFVEFAVDEASAAGLGAVFERMGFRRAGAHRSKQAVLYRQGEVALILNAQPGSFARERFGSFGASVCALGVYTQDPVGALSRAQALQSARFESPVGAGEVVLPAIVSPGGIVVYFVPEKLAPNGLFDADFVLEETGGAAGAGPAAIDKLDYLALGMNIGQRDTWTLFARAVLGLKQGDNLQFADPYGLVDITSAANADGSLRLVLTVSQSLSTDTARAAQQQGGVAVHHLAFSSNDIFATVRAWKAAGIAMTPVSQNYYDDLASRLDLAPALLERLREHGVLYDRDAGGEYLHCYTDNLAGHFFCEAVQRLGDYAGMGVLNASARVAARAQAGRV